MKINIKKALIITLTFLFLIVCVGCSGNAKSYENREDYKHLFAQTDDAAAIELKNEIIAQLEAYNNDDADGYYKLFNMSKDDLNFNIAQFDAMRKTAVLTYTPESIETAFINEDNAQALITMTCRCEDRNTGEVLYYYRTSTTYTMVRDGKWKITLQTPGSEEDLMHTLNTTENDTAQ
jgi:hypothetical protein